MMRPVGDYFPAIMERCRPPPDEQPQGPVPEARNDGGQDQSATGWGPITAQPESERSSGDRRGEGQPLQAATKPMETFRP